eukprot:2937424-Lingulodinium_polyedra.AAC.1
MVRSAATPPAGRRLLAQPRADAKPLPGGPCLIAARWRLALPTSGEGCARPLTKRDGVRRGLE